MEVQGVEDEENVITNVNRATAEYLRGWLKVSLCLFYISLAIINL